MPSNSKLQTRFCIATPVGRGAVATVIVQGHSSHQIVNQLFRSKRNQPISKHDFGSILYGNWLENSRLGEDLVVCPVSEDRIEIHCHGGEIAVELISNSLLKHGATHCDTAEFASCVIETPYFAALHMAIILAQTTRAAKWLWDQPHWHQVLLDNLSEHIEAKNSAAAIELIDQCLQLQRFGLRIVDGWSIILCGQPNVGKSSLINALLGFQRAIVHSTPGTTRDVVETKTALDGWPVRLSDTAGIRKSTDDIEQQGIDQARQIATAADLVILVVDSSETSAAAIDQQQATFSPDLIIANKCDLKIVESPLVDVSVSATSSDGIEKLVELIATRIDQSAPQINVPFPVSVYQVTSLAAMRQYLKAYYWTDAKVLLQLLKSQTLNR